MQIDLTGKNVLLTGASRGIGAAILKTLLESGARVCAHYNRSGANLLKISKDSPECIPVQANLADTQDTQRLFETAIEQMGKIDVLINNAGIAIQSPIDKDSEEWVKDWNRTLQVNLTASALLCKDAILHFQEQGGGIIINIASRASFRGDTSEFLAYAASKGGMVSLTRSIVREFGKDQIAAYTIAPGFVKTDMADQFIQEYGEEFIKSDMALNELTTPEDLAPTIVFLASGKAFHATGATIDINAGSYVH